MAGTGDVINLKRKFGYDRNIRVCAKRRPKTKDRHMFTTFGSNYS